MAERTVLLAERCVLGDDASSLRVGPARIEVEGARIVAVGPFDGPQPTATERIGGRYLVSPAFVNGHTHLSMAGFRGLGGVTALAGNVIEDLYYALESSLEPAAVRAFVRMGALESLLHGVGLVWDHYYHGPQIAEALDDIGLSGVVAPTLQNLAGPGCEQLEAQIEATLEIDADAALAERGIGAALGPHATDTVSNDLWQRIAELSRDRHLPIHAHVAQSFAEVARAYERHGCSPAALLERLGVLRHAHRMLLVHGVFLSDPDFELIDPARHVLGYCPFSQMQFCFPAAVRRWTSKQLPWLVATDCVPSNDSMNVQKELRLVAGLRGFRTTESSEYESFLEGGRFLDAELVEAHRRATFDQWHAMADPGFLLSRVWSVPGGLHPRLPAGAVEAGRLANLVVWDLDHPAFWPADDPLRALAMGDTSMAIDGMMVAGKWVSERGNHHVSLLATRTARDAKEEAEARLREHLTRAGLGG